MNRYSQRQRRVTDSAYDAGSWCFRHDADDWKQPRRFETTTQAVVDLPFQRVLPLCRPSVGSKQVHLIADLEMPSVGGRHLGVVDDVRLLSGGWGRDCEREDDRPDSLP